MITKTEAIKRLINSGLFKLTRNEDGRYFIESTMSGVEINKETFIELKAIGVKTKSEDEKQTKWWEKIK